MTTIAFRDGVLAADSRETSGDEDSGQMAALCEKLYRVGPFVVALQGDTTPGMVWLAWFRNWECGVRPSSWEPSHLPWVDDHITDRFLANDADFTAVILCPDRSCWIYDEWGTPQKVSAPYYAVGSGSKAANGAMHSGASAVAAVEAACAHDPYSSLPVHSSEVI